VQWVGTHYFAGIDGDWGDDPDALAAALRADWPEMAVTPASGEADLVAYNLELGLELGSLHADGSCIAFKHAEELVIRLAAWWRKRIPDSVALAVFNDSTATPVYVQPGMTAAELAARVAAVEAEWAG
jgi:hypothetical protein